jgi:hypothetical protein
MSHSDSDSDSDASSASSSASSDRKAAPAMVVVSESDFESDDSDDEVDEADEAMAFHPALNIFDGIPRTNKWVLDFIRSHGVHALHMGDPHPPRESLSRPSPRVQLALIAEGGGDMVRHFADRATPAARLAALESDGTAIQHQNRSTRNERLAAVRQTLKALSYGRIDARGDEQMHMAMIEAHGARAAAPLIVEPCERVQLEMAACGPPMLRFIEKPSERVILAAVNASGDDDEDALDYIEPDTLSEAVVLALVDNCKGMIPRLPARVVTPAVRLAAIHTNYRVIDLLGAPTECEIKAALRIAITKHRVEDVVLGVGANNMPASVCEWLLAYDPFCIRHLQTRADAHALCLVAVRADGQVLKYVKAKYASEEVQVAAALDHERALRHCSGAAKAVALAAVERRDRLCTALEAVQAARAALATAVAEAGDTVVAHLKRARPAYHAELCDQADGTKRVRVDE